VVRKSQTEYVAFAPQCTHLGCGYHWNEPSNHFVCPCHASEFSVESRMLAGPAPRPLDRYEWKIENGKLLLGEVQEREETSG
jgi:menaquinol-cytochrome c reductase iron-sulfur subunit